MKETSTSAAAITHGRQDDATVDVESAVTDVSFSPTTTFSSTVTSEMKTLQH